MQQTILTNDQMLFLQEEKQTLGEVLTKFAGFDLPADDLSKLKQAINQLDELFLVVAVGEFNAGKSALVNALLGEKILPEGVTPTTARVTLIRWGEKYAEQIVDDGFAIVTHPLPLLRELNIVDSPGTNAINRQHERLTDDYVPRSDLVLFVTSAERPLTQSERQFLERILSWGKKVTLIINKADLLEDDPAASEVREFVRANAAETLGTQPEIFLVSARLAQKAANSGDAAEVKRLREASGLAELERYINETLNDRVRLELKLQNPLGVARNLRQQASLHLEAQKAGLAEDARLVDTLEGIEQTYDRGLAGELPPRLAEVENILHEFEQRGLDFFDRNLRLRNILKLVNADKIKAAFEEEVQADVAAQIDTSVRNLIDWLVDKDLQTWYQVAGLLERRQQQSEKQVLEGMTSPQFERRARLIESVASTIKVIVEGYDRKTEVEELGILVQDSVAQTALFGVGALGIGALVATVITTRALDVTGIVSAGTLAVLGLFVIPYKHEQARKKFKAKMDELRSTLMSTLERAFKAESDAAQTRLDDSISPYTDYVRGEQSRVDQAGETLQAISSKLTDLQGQIGKIL